MLALAPLFSFAQGEKKTDAPFKNTCTKTNFFPFLKKGYRPQIAAALVGGVQMNNTEFDETTSLMGVELSLQCPLLCTRKNYIRQQLSITQSDGSQLHFTNIELNPHYRLKVTKAFELSAGPGFGVSFVKVGNASTSLFTYGVGASAQYYFKKVFVAVEPRYMLTDDVKMSTQADGLLYSGNFNSLKVLAKVGLRF